MKKHKNCTCADIAEDSIHKIGSALVMDGKTVVVRKKGTDGFISLGGTHDGDESHEENLRKEAMEELQLSLENFEYIGRFEDNALFENVPLILDLYLIECSGQPKPDSEIKEFVWLSKKDWEDKKYKLGAVLENHIIPELIKRNLM